MKHLKELLVRHNVTQTALARVLERDKSAITNLLNGKRQLKADEVIKIAGFLNISELEVLGVDTDGNKSNVENDTSDEYRWIPFQTPPTVEAQKSQLVTQEGDYFYFYDGGTASEKTYALEVMSNALVLSGIMIGDIVISELDKPVKSGDIVVVQHYTNNETETLLRKYQPPYLVPHSSNPEFKRLHEERSNVHIISPVVKLVRIMG